MHCLVSETLVTAGEVWFPEILKVRTKLWSFGIAIISVGHTLGRQAMWGTVDSPIPHFPGMFPDRCLLPVTIPAHSSAGVNSGHCRHWNTGARVYLPKIK